MQYTVLVAEDEPLALKTVCSIIERKCPDFRVISTAENGKDALAKVRELRPDLVITDIRMPLLSGTEMAELIHREMPEICVLIISGYAEFEYAQSAIRSDVTDYLLKPIVPSALIKSLEYAEGKILRNYYNKRNQIIKKLCWGNEVPADQMARYLPYDRFYMAVICRGSLPGRYGLGSKKEIYNGIDEQYYVFGRSENEALYLIPDEILSGREFERYMNRLFAASCSDSEFYTLIYRSEAVETNHLLERIRELYHALDFNCRIGENTFLEIRDPGCRETYDKETEKELESITWNAGHYAASGALDALKSEIARGYLICRKRHCSQIQAENWTRNLVYAVYRQGCIIQSPNMLELEIGDLFSQAVSMEDISNGIIGICLGEENAKRTDKIDSQEFFDRIRSFLGQNLDRQLSVRSVSETFSISQTYVNRLFRKYIGNSFSQTLTQMRMDRAREMFDQEPKPFIKDVALAVGYTDQFYFSRVFRSYTGMSPSEYMKEGL